MNTAVAGSQDVGSGARRAGEAPFVMVAEDDEELRRLVAETLVEDGCDVRTAADGRQLLAMLSAVTRGELPMPSLIVLDVRMPRCSGMDVLTALRLAEWEVPVVIITAFGSGELHAAAGTLGASAVLDKPFELDTLRYLARVLSEIPATSRFRSEVDPPRGGFRGLAGG